MVPHDIHVMPFYPRWKIQMSNEVLSDKEKVAGSGDVNFPWKMDVGPFVRQPQVYVPCHKSSAIEGRRKARRSLLKVSVVLMANHHNV